MHGKSPVEVFLPEKNVINERKRFRAFGEPVWIHKYNQSDKLAPRAERARIVGYGLSYKTYRVLTESGRVTTAQSPLHRISGHKNQSSTSMELSPLPSEEPLTGATEENESPSQIITTENPTEQSSLPSFNHSLTSSNAPGSFPTSEYEPRRSQRANAGKYPNRYGWSAQAMLADVTISAAEANNGKDKELWSQAREKELDQLQKYKVYEELDEIPAGKHTCDTK